MFTQQFNQRRDRGLWMLEQDAGGNTTYGRQMHHLQQRRHSNSTRHLIERLIDIVPHTLVWVRQMLNKHLGRFTSLHFEYSEDLLRLGSTTLFERKHQFTTRKRHHSQYSTSCTRNRHCILLC